MLTSLAASYTCHLQIVILLLSDRNYQVHYFVAMVLAGYFCVSRKPPNSDMGYRIFNMCTDFNACDCTWGGGGVSDTVKESALKADSGRKDLFLAGESKRSDPLRK